jgi:hypothetical protein
MILLSLGVPEMGKTQCAMDYVLAHSFTHRFFVVCRAGDWQAVSRDERGVDRWRGAKWDRWDSTQRKLTEKLRPWSYPAELQRAFFSLAGAGEDGGPSRPRRWFGEAPPPESDVSSWLATLPPTGVFRFGWPWDGEPVADLVKLVGNTTYVDDEIDLVALNNPGWPANPLRDFCHRGRHLPNASGVATKVHVFGCARRPESLHVDMTALAAFIWCFRIQGHHTLNRLRADRVVLPGEEQAMTELPPYHYKGWSPSRGIQWGALAPLGARGTSAEARTVPLPEVRKSA